MKELTVYYLDTRLWQESFIVFQRRYEFYYNKNCPYPFRTYTFHYKISMSDVPDKKNRENVEATIFVSVYTTNLFSLSSKVVQLF